MWRWLLVVGSMLSCVACTPVLSREVRALVDPHVTYADIAANPEANIGKVLLAAGTIIEAENLQQGTRLEILQYPADSRGRPQTDQPSGGRFLILTPGYLETTIYRPGRAITVAGEVTGQQELSLGETAYRYPVLAPRELHLWQEGASFPPVHIGIGFGIRIRL